MAALSATWFDGQSAQAHPCELSWQDGELLLQHSATGAVRRYGAGTVIWPERTRHGRRQLLLPDGGVVAVADAATWDDWAEQVGLTQPLAVRWALTWRGVLLAFVLLLATALSAWRWGIPWAAERVANWTPQELEQRLGRRVMGELESRGWVKESRLPPALQQRVQDAVGAMAGAAYLPDQMPRYTVHLRRAPEWLGPNAFALPGGDIVVTDALVELLQDDSANVNPALLGVVAHELGHVRERHGLRMVVEASAISALAGWWIGDYSSILAGAPALLVQSGYSRTHERSADREALRVMRAAAIDPRAMVQFFSRLKKAEPKRDGDDTMFGLASHPGDSERIRFFEEGAKGSP